MAERKKAPQVTVVVTHVDERWEIAKAWDKKEPEHTHVWMSSDVDAQTLQRGALEVCMHEGNIPERCSGSILCKRPKEVEQKSRFRREQASLCQLREAVMAGGKNEELGGGKKMKLEYKRKPRKPPQIEEDEED